MPAMLIFQVTVCDYLQHSGVYLISLNYTMYLTMIELAYVCIFVFGYVKVFLLDGLHLGRQTFRD